MRYLLDAHSVIWALDNPSRLGTGAVTVLENPENELVVSTATIWEMAIKGLKKAVAFASISGMDGAGSG